MTGLLEIEDLCVTYGPIPALRGVSITVAPGEIVGLIGPNGAGKTSTLAAVTGRAVPTRGEVRFDGQRLNRVNPEDIVRHGISIVPEGREIFGGLSVAENLMLGATARRDQRAINSDRERLLERFPILRTYLHKPAAKLSGGEQQQLAIARALMAKPRLLLLDEPSLGLAPLIVDLVFEVMAELRDDGITVLLVEQNAARTVAFADRTYVLINGLIAAEGTPDELAQDSDIAELYMGV